jgi:hypothetical protein
VLNKLSIFLQCSTAEVLQKKPLQIVWPFLKTYLQKLHKLMTSKCTFSELVRYFIIRITSVYYNQTCDQILSSPSDFNPKLSKLLTKSRFVELHRSIHVSRTPTSGDEGYEASSIQAVEYGDLQRTLNDLFAPICFVAGSTILSIDDDKLRFGSKAWSKFGAAMVFTRNQSKCPVRHCAVSINTKLYLAGVLQLRGSTVLQDFQTLLMAVMRVAHPDQIKGTEQVIAMDRGYEVAVPFVRDKKFSYVHTSQRSAGFPFVYAATPLQRTQLKQKARDGTETRIVVPTTGALNARWATSTLNSDVALSHSSGTGRVALVLTNISECQPNRWIAKLAQPWVPRTLSNSAELHRDDDEPWDDDYAPEHGDRY